METKKISDLPINDSVLYRGKKYRVDNIENEGSLKSIRLVFLGYPREKINVLWHPDSLIDYSELVTTRHFIISHTEGTKFELEDIEPKEWDLGIQSHQCMKYLSTGNKVCISIHKCFGSYMIGCVYLLP